MENDSSDNMNNTIEEEKPQAEKNKLSVDETDAKIRLLLELSNQKEIQILSYTPLRDYKLWSPKRMYNNPIKPYYYVFINDRELIRKVREIIGGSYEMKININTFNDKLIKTIKNEEIYVEYNGCTVEEVTASYKNNNSNLNFARNVSSSIINNDNFDAGNESINDLSRLEEKYILFCRVNIEDFGFIDKFNEINNKEKFLLELKKSTIYARKGPIKKLMNIKSNISENIPNESLFNKNQIQENIPQNDQQKNEQDILKNIDNVKKEDDGIDGHWFLINYRENEENIKTKNNENDYYQYPIEFLSLIKYKEISSASDNQDPTNTRSSIVAQNPNYLTSNKMNDNLDDSSNKNKEDIYQQPYAFSYYNKESKDQKKYITAYQNKSCKYHTKKNDFWCKDCGVFCCLECFADENSSSCFHKNHNIKILEDCIIDIEKDLEILNFRLSKLKEIISTEIKSKLGQITELKKGNEEFVKELNKEVKNYRMEIKKEEINRAKVLGSLGTEVMRIITDYSLKMKYLNTLYLKGDMTTYLQNFFMFKKVYEEDTRKNLAVLEKKISETEQTFSENSKKLRNAITALNSSLKNKFNL